MLDLSHSCKILQINQMCVYELGTFMHKIVPNCFPRSISCCCSHFCYRDDYPTRKQLPHFSDHKAHRITRRSIKNWLL